MAKTNIVGIDLGTTYSAIARLDRFGQPAAIANAEGEFSMPSVVYFGGSGPVVGSHALRLAISESQRVCQNAKRFLGEPQAGWTIDSNFYSPVDVSALILKKLKTDAEEQIGPIDRAVVTVPAHFDAQRRRMTIDAAKKAGINVLDIVNEPVAAALCFVLGEEGMILTEIAEEQLILVYDLGGGTFDLSLVHYDPENVRVLATSGDLHLGGIDWNARLIAQLADAFSDKHGLDPRSEPRSLQQLALAVEEAKRSLSIEKHNETVLSINVGAEHEDFTLKREDFERLTADLVYRTQTITSHLLDHSGYGWGRINTILSVGGSTRMPMIRRMLRGLAGVTPNYSLSPDLSIAQGAALYAGILMSKSDDGTGLTTEASSRLKGLKTTNVNAHSLGLMVRVAGNRRVNHIVIPRNTPLPASVSQTFGTVKKDQERIRLRIVEGEAKEESEIETICHCVIDDLPAGLPEGSAIDVNLSYKENGLLEVIARHRDSGMLATVSLMREKGLAGRAQQAQPHDPSRTEVIDTSPAPPDSSEADSQEEPELETHADLEPEPEPALEQQPSENPVESDDAGPAEVESEEDPIAEAEGLFAAEEDFDDDLDSEPELTLDDYIDDEPLPLTPERDSPSEGETAGDSDDPMARTIGEEEFAHSADEAKSPPRDRIREVGQWLDSDDPVLRIRAIEVAHSEWLVELFPRLDELARFDLESKVRDAANAAINAVRTGDSE